MKWIWPSTNHEVTCGFYCYAGHDAVDLDAVFEPFWASRAGLVITADQNVVYGEREGKYIEVLHYDGWVSRYFHLSVIGVKVGQHVEQGQVLGVTGNTGYVTDSSGVHPYVAHLHFALEAPTKAEALTVWSDPRPTHGRWAVDPHSVIEGQSEEDDMGLTVIYIAPESDKAKWYIYDPIADTKKPSSLPGFHATTGTGIPPVPVDGVQQTAGFRVDWTHRILPDAEFDAIKQV